MPIIQGQQHTGYRIQDTGYRIQDTGYRIQDTGCSDNFVFILSIEISTLFSIAYSAPKVTSSKVKIDENFATYLSRATKV